MQLRGVKELLTTQTKVIVLRKRMHSTYPSQHRQYSGEKGVTHDDRVHDGAAGGTEISRRKKTLGLTDLLGIYSILHANSLLKTGSPDNVCSLASCQT